CADKLRSPVVEAGKIPAVVPIQSTFDPEGQDVLEKLPPVKVQLLPDVQLLGHYDHFSLLSMSSLKVCSNSSWLESSSTTDCTWGRFTTLRHTSATSSHLWGGTWLPLS